MRCIALAACWIADGGTATLVSRELPSALRARAIQAGIAVREIAAIGSDPEEWLGVEDGPIVVDGWDFDAGYLEAVAARNRGLLVVDDNVERHRFPGDLLLNPNVYASSDEYAGRSQAKLLLGPSYAPLRQEFAARRSQRRATGRVRNILILLGGADPQGYSEIVLANAVAAADELGPHVAVRLVAGAANQRLLKLQSAVDAAAANRRDISLCHDVRDIASLMLEADVAVSAAGSTIWELCCLGVPAVLGALNAGEARTGARLAELGIAAYVGPFATADEAAICGALVDLARDPDRRFEFGCAGQALVDGHGAKRIVEELRHIARA